MGTKQFIRKIVSLASVWMLVLTSLTSPYVAVSVVAEGGIPAGEPGSVELDKSEVPLGSGLYEVTLQIDGVPLVKATDIVLVIDTSGSMEGTRMSSAISAANSFIDLVIDSNQGHRIAIVEFNSLPAVIHGFSTDADSLHDVINDLVADGGTHLEGGIHVATELLQSDSLSTNNKAIVVLGDGSPTFGYDFDPNYTGPLSTSIRLDGSCRVTVSDANQDNDAYFEGRFDFDFSNTVGSGNSIFFEKEITVSGTCSNGDWDDYDFDKEFSLEDSVAYFAQQAHGLGYSVFSIGLNVNSTGERILRDVQNSGYYTATTSDLSSIYSAIASQIVFAARNAVVTDKIGDDFEFVEILPAYLSLDASYDPVTRILTWTVGNVGTDPMILKYTLQIHDGLPNGDYPTNEYAIIDYTDIFDEVQDTYFPQPIVTITNNNPIAEDDHFNIAEGSSITEQVVATDPEGQPLTYILVTDVVHGTLTFNDDGSFTYTHDGTETTSDSFTFKATDGIYESNIASISFTIDLDNEIPVADDDDFTISEGGTENGNATGTDPDGDGLTYVLVSGPLYADYFEFNPDGSYTYTHDGSENFSDSFTFKVNDGTLDSNTATITITITPVNDAPSALDDDFTVDEGGTLDDAVFGSDPEGDDLTFILVSDVNHGTLTLNADGTFTYTHDGSENFSDSFTFKVNDGDLDSNTATITIDITPVNDTPEADDDGFAVDEGATYNGNVTGTDPDGDDLTFILVDGPTNAVSFTFNPDGSFSYVHDGSETTVDSFTFKVNDGTVDSNVATIDIVINPINDGPTSANDAFTIIEGASYPGTLAGVDPDGPSLSWIIVTLPTQGTLVQGLNGAYTYTHNGGTATADSFTFYVTDGLLSSQIYTVNITITQLPEPNGAPVSTPDAITVNEGGSVDDRVNGSDPDGDAITYILVGDVVNGTLIFNANGTYRYTHNGSETTADSFSYRVSDGRRLSAISVVTITVIPVNEAPVAVNGELDTDFEEPVNGSLVSLISDVDSTSFAYILVTDVQHGTLTLNADGTFTYTPDAGFEGEDSFTFKANDGELDSNVATFTITVAEEVIIVDPETPLAPLNYWWLLLLPLLLLLLFLRPNLKYELVDASGNKKTIRRHIFAKGDEDVFVDLNDKDMKDLVHVDLTVYKQLVKRQQGQKITFNLFKKPMKTIEVPDDMKDPIKDRIEL